MLEQQKIESISLNEFMERFEEQPFELIDGEMIIVSPLKHLHMKVVKAIYDALFLWTHSNKGVGQVFMEGTFVLEDKSDWVKGSRIPDVMFYKQSRLDYYYENTKDYNDKPLVLVPDVVVEVISPTDAYSDVERKAELYLEDGVTIIWIVDPKRKTVKEYTPQNPDGTNKRDDDVLSGGDVAEGFEMKISEIFA